MDGFVGWASGDDREAPGCVQLALRRELGCKREIWGYGWDLKPHDQVTPARECIDRREKRAA